MDFQRVTDYDLIIPSRGFRLLEITDWVTSHVLTWEKGRKLSHAAEQFLRYIQSQYAGISFP